MYGIMSRKIIKELQYKLFMIDCPLHAYRTAINRVYISARTLCRIFYNCRFILSNRKADEISQPFNVIYICYGK